MKVVPVVVLVVLVAVIAHIVLVVKVGVGVVEHVHSRRNYSVARKYY